MNLEDEAKAKVALVLGASGGIGSAICAVCAHQGMRVYGTYFGNMQKAKEIEDSLPGLRMILCNMGEGAQIDAAVEKILAKEGRIDALINAVTTPLALKLFEQHTQEEINKDIEVMLKGSIRACQRVIPAMKKSGSGVIIHLLSTVLLPAHTPSRMSSYVIAKAGVAGMTRALSAELGAYGIRVIDILPSYVETGLLKAFPPKLLEMERQKSPDKKLLQPEDVARVIAYAITNSAACPNGAQLVLKSRLDVQKLLA